MKRHNHHYHHGNLRNALIAQALKLVEKGGAESFSLREAARLVGVSANAAYRHFGNKSDLLVAVAEVAAQRQAQHIRKAINALAAQSTPAIAAVERLKAAGRAYVEFAVAHPELVRIMAASSGFSSLEQGAPPKTEAYAMLGKAIDALVSEGVLAADRRHGAELKAWVVMHGFARLVIQGVGVLQKRALRDAALESILDFAFVGLCGRVDPP